MADAKPATTLDLNDTGWRLASGLAAGIVGAVRQDGYPPPGCWRWIL